VNGNPARAVPGAGEEGAVRPLLRAVRAHRWLVVVAALAALAGAIAYLTLRAPTYEATANILVNPLPQDDQTFLGLDLLRDSGDATRTVQTAATLLESSQAAQRTADALGGDLTADKVLNRVNVEPLGESNIVAVTATGASGTEAARLADQFSEAALAVRTQDLRDEIDVAITRAEAELRGLAPGGADAAAVSGRLSQLRAIRDTGDPTLTLEQQATVPRSPTGVGPLIVILLALIAGLALGSGGALLRDLVDRRIGDVDELIAMYPIPVLVRIPTLARRETRQLPGANWHMPPPVRQPFQSLVVQLEQRDRRMGSILITSPSQGDGKTTSSINLAVSLAATGKRVVLVDGDLRHPMIANRLRLDETRTASEIAAPGTNLRDLLVRPSMDWPLFVLPVDTNVDGSEEGEAAMRRLPQLIEDAKSLADCVVVDTPPLGEVSDALRLIPRVDDVLVVVRVGNTIRSHLETARDLLDRGGYLPEGSVILDAPDRGVGSYGYGPGGGDLVFGGDNGAPPGGRAMGEPTEKEARWADR